MTTLEPTDEALRSIAEAGTNDSLLRERRALFTAGERHMLERCIAAVRKVRGQPFGAWLGIDYAIEALESLRAPGETASDAYVCPCGRGCPRGTVHTLLDAEEIGPDFDADSGATPEQVEAHVKALEQAEPSRGGEPAIVEASLHPPQPPEQSPEPRAAKKPDEQR